MKALRFFFLSILAAFSFAASAQTIEIYKDGRVIDSFSATQVDSVVYKSAAAQPRYYYYAGWTKPSESNWLDLATLIGATLPSKNTVIKDYITSPITNDSKVRYYVVIPEGVEIWDDISNCEGAFHIYDSVSIIGYRVFESNSGSSRINAIKLVVVK